MTTTYVYADGTDNGVWCTSSSYLLARNGTGTKAVTALTGIPGGQYFSASTYYVEEGFEQFNTSVIGTDTISSATLSLYGAVKTTSGSDFNLQARVKDWGTAVSTASFVAGASLSALTLVAHFATSTPWSTAAYNSFADDALAANINKSGQTKLIFVSDRVVANTTPTGFEYVSWKYHTGGVSLPYISITHSGGTPGPALVGVLPAAAVGNFANCSPSYGQSPTAGNLLILWVAGQYVATLPSTPSGWSVGLQKAGTQSSASIFYKVAAGGDSAPTVVNSTGYMEAQLAEFSLVSLIDQSGSAAGTTSPIVATTGGTDAAIGELVVAAGVSYLGTAASGVHAINNATNVATYATVGTGYAYFAYGFSAANATADSDSYSWAGTATGSALALVSFKASAASPVTVLPSAGSLTTSLGTPTVAVTANVTAAPTSASATLTGGTPTVATTANITSQPTAAAATLTGATPTVAAIGTAAPQPSAASMTATGAVPAVVAVGTALAQPSAAAMAATGATPSVVAGGAQSRQPSAASLTATGATPSVVAVGTAAPQPTAASLTATGATPAVAAGGAQVRVPPAASLVATGAVPAVVAIGTAVRVPTAASLALAGATPSVLTPVVTAPSAGALALTGATPAVVLPVVSLPSAAGLTLTGFVPGEATPVVTLPSAAGLTLTGFVPSITVPVGVVPIAAALTFVGDVPSVTIGGGVVVGGAPALPYFVPFADGAISDGSISADDKRRAAARKRRHDKEQAEAQAIFAVAMADVLNHQRRLTEDDWLLGLTDDAEYVRRAV